MRQKRRIGPVGIASSILGGELVASGGSANIKASDETLFTKTTDLTRKTLFSTISGSKDAPFATQGVVGSRQRPSHDGARR
jgi:hypothetical protein